jgi:hypothetical protein
MATATVSTAASEVAKRVMAVPSMGLFRRSAHNADRAMSVDAGKGAGVPRW